MGRTVAAHKMRSPRGGPRGDLTHSALGFSRATFLGGPSLCTKLESWHVPSRGTMILLKRSNVPGGFVTKPTAVAKSSPMQGPITFA